MTFFTKIVLRQEYAYYDWPTPSYMVCIHITYLSTGFCRQSSSHSLLLLLRFLRAFLRYFERLNESD